MKLSLSEVADVASHQPRNAPYWHTLEFCRHVGVHKRSHDSAFWVARVRTKKGAYLQKRLGATACSSEVGITMPKAIEAARSWFSSPNIMSCSADSYPCGARADLLYCPYGDVFTVGHALKDYIEWKRIAATRSHFETNLSLINYHILPRLGGIALDEFTGRHLSKFCLEVLQTPPKRGAQKLGPQREIGTLDSEQLRKRKKTLNALIGILRLAFQLAWENGETDSERAWRCLRRLPNVDRPRVIALTRRECSMLLGACSVQLRNLVLAALFTGCRVGELTRLQACDVGRHGFGIHILPSKNYRPRFVFLPDEGMAFFLKMTEGKSDRQLVFTNSMARPWGSGYRHLFKAAVREAGLPEEFSFHGLRHTYASQLMQAGASLLVVAQQLGHANTDTVSRTYGHLAPQHREDELKARFASLGPEFQRLAVSNADKLSELSVSLQCFERRQYAMVVDESTLPRSNHSNAQVRF